VNQIAMKAAAMANAMKKPRPAPANTFTKLHECEGIYEPWGSNLEAQLAEESTLHRSIVYITLSELVFIGGRRRACIVVDNLLNETEENGDDQSCFECLSEHKEEYGD